MRGRHGVVPRDRLFRGKIGFAAASILASLALVAQTGITTNATWSDSEWAHAPIKTSECTPDGEGFLNRGEGRALSGNLLNVNLDNIVEAEGVQVTNNGSVAKATSGQPVSGIDAAWADPLTMNALSALQVPLDELLKLPADNQAGVVGQFGQAQKSGKALGSSGYIDNSGGIDLSSAPTSEYPSLATLKLSNLLNSPLLGDIGLGDSLEDVSDLELEVGAVAGQASFDACVAAWNGGLAQTELGMAASAAAEIVEGLDRRYLAASVDLRLTSPTVGKLVASIGGNANETCTTPNKSTLKALECAINALSGEPSGVPNAIRSGVLSLLGTLTNGLGLGNIDVALTATADVSAVQALLDDTITDSEGVVSVNLGDGTIRIDTTALLQAAYPGQYGDGLNGLPPNFNPLDDEAVLTALTTKLTTLLQHWVTLVSDALVQSVKDTVIYAHVKIHLKLTVTVLVPITTDIGYINAVVGCPPTSPTPVGCSLGTLLDPVQNTTVTKAEFIVLPGLANTPVVGTILIGLINGTVGVILGGLVSALITGLGGVVGTAVDVGVNSLRTLSSNVTALTRPIISTVTDLYTTLFLNNVLSLTFNAQNNPASGGPAPPDWAPGLLTAPPTGRYEVAALRIGILDGLGPNGIRLYFGRGSVGVACTVAQAAHPNSPCSDY